MIDAEVLRLRKLRGLALRTRALAKILDTDCPASAPQEQSIFARSAIICWTIARITSGRLRAHPYLSYQQGPSPLDDLADAVIASLVALNARRRNRRSSVYAQQLQSVARQLNDVRALTMSPELSDALGRMQIQMRRVTNELEGAALSETGVVLLPRVKAVAAADSGSALNEIGDTSWPYLAI
jgi:hypothetical protein